jgi:tRNA A-37 threonylcarbamoyl transferase component Bud32
MDALRGGFDEKLVWHLLSRCMDEMLPIPKETVYLAEWLNRNATAGFRKQIAEELDDITKRLQQIRLSGREDDWDLDPRRKK